MAWANSWYAKANKAVMIKAIRIGMSVPKNNMGCCFS
jgi:hypothetical protein